MGAFMTGDAAARRRVLGLRLLHLAVLLLLALAPAVVQAQSRSAVEVFGVRFGVNEGITRVVLDIDAATRYATRVLASPPRLVIELENVRWQVRSHPQGRPLGLAQTVNYGTLDAGRGRLVIDIDQPFRIQRQDWLPPSADAAHHRLVIDLVATGERPPAEEPPATTVAELPPPAPAAPSPPAPSPAAVAAEPPVPATTVAVEGPPIAGPPRPRPALPPVEITVATAAIASPSVEPAAASAAAADAGVNGDASPAGETTLATLPLSGVSNYPVLPAPETAVPQGGDEAAAGEALDGAAGGGEATLVVAPIRPAPLPARRKVIAIDPGHGGVDPGTIGINGVLEKEVTLDVAKRLRRLIEATGRYDVVLTREDDVFVSLRDRMETGRRAEAALFISIHADSLGDSRFRGASVYTLSDDASDAEAARLARKENRADVIAGTDLSSHDQTVASILIDLAQRNTNNRSIEFADVLTGELADVTALVRNTRRFAGFVVLKSPDVPSVLLELGYLSNPTDAANLARPEYRDKLARATVRAIDRYLAENDTTL
jgi:N-acetylmuramoyl-L-alanine amidase